MLLSPSRIAQLSQLCRSELSRHGLLTVYLLGRRNTLGSLNFHEEARCAAQRCVAPPLCFQQHPPTGRYRNQSAVVLQSPHLPRSPTGQNLYCSSRASGKRRDTDDKHRSKLPAEQPLFGRQRDRGLHISSLLRRHRWPVTPLTRASASRGDCLLHVTISPCLGFPVGLQAAVAGALVALNDFEIADSQEPRSGRPRG